MTSEEYFENKKRKIISDFLEKSLEDINFIGIDRSLTSTGIAIVNNNKLIFQEEIKIKSFGADRLIEIIKIVLSIIKNYNNPLVCMENYSYNSKGRVFQLGEIGGIFFVFLTLKQISFIDIEPTVLKKYVAGSGNCSKDLIPMNINRKFSIVPIGGDAADAIGCAMLGFNSFNYKKGLGKYTQVERDVFETFLSAERKKKNKSSKAKNKQLELEINE